MDREPRVAERIHAVVRDRLGGDIVTPQGDLVSEELEGLDGLERRAANRDPP
jgi:hypothetical protein